MRSLVFISLICICHLTLIGQSAEEEVIRLKQSGSEPAGEVEVRKEQSASEESAGSGLTEDRIPGNWNVTLGTGYSYMKGYGSGMMFYAAPSYTIPLNNRWAFHGGMMATQYKGLNAAFSGESLLPDSFYSFALFAAATYQLNDRLVLHGTGVKQLVSAPVTPFTPYPMDNLSLGATYRLGDNISIGATIHMNNGRGYYATPFGGHSFQSPIFW